VPVTDADGVSRTFHVLDSWADRIDGGPGAVEDQVGVLLCVHGNPTWSYLWRHLVASAPPGWRVIAPDQLSMGHSERIDKPRVLAERVDDLQRLTDAMGVTGAGSTAAVVTVAHDWGGIVSMGWALANRRQLQAVVLTNTAVHQPEGDRGPVLIRLAHLPLVNRIVCSRTPLFLRVTTSLTWPRPGRTVRDAFAEPYRTARRRAAISDFVTDIPFAAAHPSNAEARRIADGMQSLDVPALLLWGPRDPVFGDVYLRDLRSRLPQAVVHRYEKASHLLPEDAPEYTTAVTAFLDGRRVPLTAPEAGHDVADEISLPSALARLSLRGDDRDDAVVEVGGRRISWADLRSKVDAIAAGLDAAGLRPGDRVALLVPPSIDLTVALYAVWRAGGVIVVADKGLGLNGMGRALRSAELDFVLADTAGLLASRLMRLPGRRIAVRRNSAAIARVSRTWQTLPALAAAGQGGSFATEAAGNDEAAVLFTSGATGPAKGVLYRHRQLRAQLELIRTTYRLTPDDRIVAAFAPFALYGPALGLRSAVPDSDVTKPGRLTAAALGDAAVAIGATVVFASPAALRNVVATAAGLNPAHRTALAGVRLVMSAGASIPAHLLREVATVLPSAQIHTPYGMTEALPLTDVSLAEIEAAGDGDGVCVGRPLPGVELALAPLDHTGAAASELTGRAGVSGEIWARAAHIRDRYDASWAHDQAAAGHPGWHRTGDVGAFDDTGRLWIQGRTVHVITTADGPVTPVGVEIRVQRALAECGRPIDPTAGVAAVGVGPAGTQQVVVVLAGPGGPLAPADLFDVVRGAAGVPIASLLVTGKLPVDIRHNSKIDRVALGTWATKVLSGG